MQTVQNTQPIDVVLVVLWVGAIAWGVSAGVVRQIVLLVATYLAAVCAGGLYGLVGAYFTDILGSGQAGPARLLAYVALYVVALGAIIVVSLRAYPQTRFRRLSRWDGLGGGLVAAMWGALLLIFIAVMLELFAAVFWPAQSMNQDRLRAQIGHSRALGALEYGIQPLWPAIQVWFPREVPPHITS